jgi:hypothetical protein
MFELGKDLFDRIEIGTVGRQEDEMGASGADGVARGLPLVAAEIVQDDDVAFDQGRSENLLCIDSKELPIDGTVDDPRRADPIQAQRGDEGHRLPMAVGHRCLQPPASRTPAAKGSHIGFDPGLVNEDQPRGVNLTLMGLPALPPARDIRPILLGGPICFF